MLQRRKPRIRTGFPQIDGFMGGGLYPGLMILGAGPSTGKSTFVLQMAENISRISEGAVPVIFFSLEMQDDRIAAKMLSRNMFLQDPGHGTYTEKDALKRHITADDFFSEDKALMVLREHRKAYEEASADTSSLRQFYILEGKYSAEKIVRTVWGMDQELAKQAAAEGRSYIKPLIIVDYLQILAADPSVQNHFINEKQIVEHSLEILKGLADGNRDSGRTGEGFPVLLISSLSRGNYSGEQVLPLQMDAFKETGGIEYSADVLLGLQYTACHYVNPKNGRDYGCDPNKEKLHYPREMEISCMKQRFGSSGWQVKYRYYAPFDCFEEIPALTEEAAKETDKEAMLPQMPIRDLSFMNNLKVANEIRKGVHVYETRKCSVFGEGRDKVFTSYRVMPRLTWEQTATFLSELIPPVAGVLAHTEDTETRLRLITMVSDSLAEEIRWSRSGSGVFAFTQSNLETICRDTYRIAAPYIHAGDFHTLAEAFLQQIRIQDPEEILEALAPELLPAFRQHPETKEVLIEKLTPCWEEAGSIPEDSSAIGKLLYSYLAPDRRWKKRNTAVPDPILSCGRRRQALLGGLMQQLSRTLSCFDCDVADAVYAYCRHESIPCTFSLSQILQELTGEKSMTLTKEKALKLQESLQKLATTDILLDGTEEMRGRKRAIIGEEDTWTYCGPMLALQTEGQRYLGETPNDLEAAPSYTIADRNEMPMFRYMAVTSQVVAFPKELLHVRKVKTDGNPGRAMSNTWDMIQLKRYLLRKLEVMRGSHKSYRMNVIHFGKSTAGGGIYEALGVDKRPYSSETAKKNKLRSIREDTEAVLQYYKSIGYIKDFRVDGTESITILAKPADPFKLFEIRKKGS